MVNQLTRQNKANIEDDDFTLTDFAETTERQPESYALEVERHQYKTLWTYALNIFLGLWLIAAPFLFDYRSSSLVWSDTISGAAIILFELVAFSPKRFLVRWLTPATGLWLLFAPLVFWSPTAAVYLNDTIVGIFVIALAMVIPGMPGRGWVELPGPDFPRHWTYNPSSWIRRWIGIALALLGFFISRYLAAYQLGYTSSAWDPFFGGESEKVLTSSVSHAFPISDAGFGSIAYIMEAFTGFMGDRARWRSAPWVVVLFACLVIPLGVTSVVLVMLQPTVVGAWCGLCLIAAAGLLTSLPLAVHEAVAVGQFLMDAHKKGKNIWSIFWMGGSMSGNGAEGMDPDRRAFSPVQRWIASIQGVTVPLTLGLQLAIGIWLMARPDVLSFSGDGSVSNCDHLLGAIVVTAAALASAEVTRTARFINVVAGAFLVLAGIVFANQIPALMINDILCGIVVAVSSIPRGELFERYGTWDQFVL